MDTTFSNPFTVTKAVDYSDQEILDAWVDLPTGGGFSGVADPTSPMPLLLLGGKGSGRTHLMRYYSFPLQFLRYGGNTQMAVFNQRYLGIYCRLSGLNSSRFVGKGIDLARWDEVYSYYMDLWISQTALAIYREVLRDVTAGVNADLKFVRNVLELFDDPGDDKPETVDELIGVLRGFQREVDVAVNNAALTGLLPVHVRATRGRLVFGIPQAAAREALELRSVRVLYLLDEFENLPEQHQIYVNTLIREKEAPASFFVGSRLYGVRTQATYTTEEPNKEGSEFHVLRLDDFHLADRKRYATFARSVVGRRLQPEVWTAGGPTSMAEDLDKLFEQGPGPEEWSQIVKRSSGEQEGSTQRNDPPCLVRMRSQLERANVGQSGLGLRTGQTVESVIELLRWPDDLLLEKTNCFLFYRAWSDGKELSQAAAEVRSSATAYAAGQRAGSLHDDAFEHFRSDLIAQLRRDLGVAEDYGGLENFVEMSGGMLRNLLIILKSVYHWSMFSGERPFAGQPISSRSQRLGVEDASAWFFAEAQIFGQLGEDVRAGIVNLGDFLEQLRYSDKPSESSLVAFTADLTRCSHRARETIYAAEDWSLLRDVDGGTRDRNSRRTVAKYQLHPMLAPRWGLPIHRRGTVALRSDEVDAIFGGIERVKLETVLRKRLSGMTAPFGRSRPGETRLPGMDDA